MNPDIKAEWITALRSGDYTQTSGALYNTDENGYCCLGVLCEIAVKHGVIPPGTRSDVNMYATYGTMNDHSMSVLPEVVAQWAGVGTHGFIDEPNISLIEQNDGSADFDEIADIIEEYL